MTESRECVELFHPRANSAKVNSRTLCETRAARALLSVLLPVPSMPEQAAARGPLLARRPLWSLAAGGANFIAETLHCPTLRRNTVEASLLVLLALAVINNGMAPVLRLFIRTRVVLKVSLPYAPRAELVEEHITTAVCVHFSKQLLGLLAR